MQAVTCRVRIVELTSVEEAEGLVRLFEVVSEEQGWRPGDQLRAHLGNAVHLAAYLDGELAGGIQLVLPDSEGRLPYRGVWPDVELVDAAQVGHVTVLALARPFRGHPGLFWQVCVELWRRCVADGTRCILLEATPPMLRLYRRIGFPLEVVGDLREHWGEPCFLCKMGTAEVAGTVLVKAVRSEAYRQMVALACRPPAASVALPTGLC